MNTNPPATGAEEGAISPSLEKLPKLNLPPKPILATTATTAATPATPATAPTSALATKPVSEPPPILTVSEKNPPAPVVPPVNKPEVAEAPTPNKKRATLSMPLALVAFVVALFGLIVQVVAFLHLL